MPRVAGILAVILPWAGSALAQEATGHVEGRVLLQDATPAASVRVAASSPSLQLTRAAETDVRGYFRLSALPVGTYRVRMALVGYRPVVFEGVSVRLGRTTSLGETQLQTAAFELAEIIVRADRPLVDVTSAATVTNIPSEQFEVLPTARDFRSIVSLAPQANLSFLPDDEVNIAGGTGPENAYFLDGVNITDPHLGATSSNLPYNFVRELQVKAGGYEAEFGRATGGIIDVITHSGGNRFGGQVFGFFTGKGLTAEPRFAVAGTEEREFSEYDVGGSLGGPIIRDQLWFFAAYNPSFRRQRVDVRGPDLADDRLVQHLLASKLTWAAGPRTNVVITVHGDPGSHREYPHALLWDSVANAEAVTQVLHQGGLVLSALVRHQFSQVVQAELGVARFTRDNNLETESEFARTAPHFQDFTIGVVSGGLGHDHREHTARSAIRASISAALGRHSVKAGIEYENNRLDLEEDYSARPGAPGGLIQRLGETTYLWHRGSVGGSFQNRIPTAYLQDSWRAGRRVTLNAGLRWEGQYLAGTNGTVAQSFTRQWQPRVGFTYQPGQVGSQKVFGSFARFYEQIPLLSSTFYYNDAGYGLTLGYDHDPRFDPSGADTLNNFGAPEPEPRHDLEGQYFDEFTLGYERTVGREFRAGVRGMYRELRWAVEDAVNPTTGQFTLGNPGRGHLDFAPRARRSYTALLLTFERPWDRRFGFLASYVLSRSRGNYQGLYDYEQGHPFPNAGTEFDLPEQYPNSTGRLPNDRPHTFKFAGSYRFDLGITVGTAIAWMSGMPRDELALSPNDARIYLQPRGWAGRTDAIFDAGLRLTYDWTWRGTGLRPKLYIDLFHLGNRRTAVRLDDVHYLGVDADGNPINPSPTYGRPQVFQPPTSARLGISIDFGSTE